MLLAYLALPNSILMFNCAAMKNGSDWLHAFFLRYEAKSITDTKCGHEMLHFEKTGAYIVSIDRKTTVYGLEACELCF